jgi:transcriptional regulator with XRE-family HTH domain
VRLGRLTEWREARGLTQKQLAAAAHVGRRTVTRAESGEPIRTETAHRLAEGLQVEVYDLLGSPPVSLSVPLDLFLGEVDPSEAFEDATEEWYFVELNATEKLHTFCEQLKFFLDNFSESTKSGEVVRADREIRYLMNMQRMMARVAAALTLPWMMKTSDESEKFWVVWATARLVKLMQRLEMVHLVHVPEDDAGSEGPLGEGLWKLGNGHGTNGE